MAIAFTSCKKDEETPTQSQPKENQVSCSINGSAWASLPEGRSIKMGDSLVPAVSFSVEADTLSMTFVKVNGTDTNVITGVATLNTPRVGACKDAMIFYFKNTDLATLYDVILNYQITSSVTITKFDATNKKISGTFNSSMKHKSGGTNYEITNGAFTDASFIEIK